MLHLLILKTWFKKCKVANETGQALKVIHVETVCRKDMSQVNDENIAERWVVTDPLGGSETWRVWQQSTWQTQSRITRLAASKVDVAVWWCQDTVVDKQQRAGNECQWCLLPKPGLDWPETIQEEVHQLTVWKENSQPCIREEWQKLLSEKKQCAPARGVWNPI